MMLKESLLFGMTVAQELGSPLAANMTQVWTEHANLSHVHVARSRAFYATHFSLTAMASRFEVRKAKILEQLGATDEEYHDLSPKGSVDKPIRDLIGEINCLEGLVTTSSCSGRISVFLEGRKTGFDEPPAEENEQSRAGPGGKGGGGAWLFISHTAIDSPREASTPNYMSKFGLSRAVAESPGAAGVQSRYIHLKFEPMVSLTFTELCKS
jgi:tRNA(Phe) wybutosine-synthesizing methylase Tyw3